jgi:hypothetical protein
MRLAEHKSEGDDEQLITEVVVDVHDPAAPIFEAPSHSEGSHDTRFSEVVYHGAAAIDQNLVTAKAVEMRVGHVQPPSNDSLS